MFHDIGKFYQRTRGTEAKEQVKAVYRWYAEGIGRNYDTHSDWSAYFLRSAMADSLIESIALRHHRPESDLERLVTIADRLSAKERDDHSEEEKGKRRDVSDVGLHSVLASISGVRSEQGTVGYKHLRYNPIENPWPTGRPGLAAGAAAYEECWQNFTEAVRNALHDKPQGIRRFWRMYQLLHDYTHTIPSAAYYNRPTISLYDHSRTTAAIACALYRQQLNGRELESLLNTIGTGGQDRELVLLVSGDISGIQDFVYDISARGAAKGLRGRSFYLAQLTEITATYLLRREKLYPCNLLWAGGGHFFLFLPASAAERLESYRQHIEQLLYTAHQGKLSLALSGITLKARDLDPKRFFDQMEKLSNASEQQKGRKFLELIRNDPKAVLGPRYEGQQVCTICGSQTDTDDEKCSLCLDFEQLGQELAHARDGNWANETFLPIGFDRIEKPMQTVAEIWACLGYQLRFSDRLVPGVINAVINCPKLPRKADRIFWLANSAPRLSDGSIASFEDLAQRSEGIQRWGVLRGDVDNLGNVFREGLGSDRSPSKVAALSREISFFFNVAFNQTCKEFNDQLYIIYAGGDDFFLVGSWSVLPIAAAKIDQEFRRYCSENPNLTLSCGISIPPTDKYPLHKAAAAAGRELNEKAKRGSKNQISFLGKAFSWGELEEIKRVKDLVYEAITEYQVSRALIFQIYAACGEQMACQQGQYPINRIWRLLYALARLSARHRGSGEIMKRLEQAIIASPTMVSDNSVYAARWAEMELRARGE